MDVFLLRDAVIGEYHRFDTSFTTIIADAIRAHVEAIYAHRRFWPGPRSQINSTLEPVQSLETLIANEARA